MTNVIFPSDGLYYQYNDRAESNEDYVEEGITIVSFVTSKDKLKISLDNFKSADKLSVYGKFEDGISISDENKIIISTKATSPPTMFNKFEVFFEDCNGVIATYALDNNMVGKEQVILTQALVQASKDFNPSFIVKAGFNFASPRKDTKFTFLLYDMHTVYRIQPTYAEPQEVIEFLGMMDNKGNPFELTDTTTPSYNAIAKRICEAEDFMENACRRAWTERRIENEIRNADSVWAASFGYLGILASDSLETGTQMFFKGIPVKLTRDSIHKIDYSKGDKVEVRRYGSEWITVPQNAVWEDEAKGIVYIKTIFFQKDASVRVTYRYGKGPCPGDIKQAVLMKAAMFIVGTDWYRQRFPQSPLFDPMKNDTLSQWTWQIKDCIRNNTDLISCGCF